MKKTDYWKYPKNAPAHPYCEFEKTPLWRTVKKAIADLEENQDLKLTEFHEYVVGYICKQLSHKKLASPIALKKIKTTISTKIVIRRDSSSLANHNTKKGTHKC